MATEVKLDQECRLRFTCKHLAKVLDRCFTGIEMDDYMVTIRRDDGESREARRKGFITKCLELDADAFRPLRSTKSKSKEFRLLEVSGCRPGGCKDATDLMFWLVKVIYISIAQEYSLEYAQK